MLRSAHRFFSAFAAVLLSAAALAEEGGYTGAVEFDPSGIWHSESQDVVVRRTGRTTWLGDPTEKGGTTSGRSFCFASTGQGRIRFWIMQEGGATTTKLAEQEIDLSEDPDRITLDIPDRRGERTKVEFTRIFAALPEKVGDLVVTFLPKGRARMSPNQDVDVRLVKLFGRALETALAADPDLRRVNVVATIDENVGLSKRHSRLLRQALAIDLVNGADADHWREDVKEKLRALEDGDPPVGDPREEYAHHVTAVVLGLLMQDGVDEVVCPAVLDGSTLPYLEWWIREHGARLPAGSPSIVKLMEKVDAMLDSTKTLRSRMTNLLFVSVANREETICRHKRCREKRYDR